MMKLILGIIIGVFLCLKVSFVHDLGNRAWDSVFGVDTTSTEYYHSGNEASDIAVNEYLGRK